MSRFNFCGGSYTLASVNADAQRALNLIPEIVESGDGRSKMTLLNTPGLFALLSNLDGPPRGQIEFNGLLFVVAGTKFYQIILNSLGPPLSITATAKNGAIALANDGLPASLDANENQILMSSGGSVYIYYVNQMNDSVTGATITAGTFKQVPASNFTLSSGNAPVAQVKFCDSFFLALIANSQSIQISNVLDGFNWIPGGSIVNGVYTGGVSSQIVVSVTPENVVGMAVDHRQVWMLGRKKIVGYTSGDPFNIFAVQPGAFIEQGAGATFAISQLDNSVFWVSSDDKGDRRGFRLNGLTPQRVTTHAVETAWRKFPKVSDAVSYSYQSGGHEFWKILFPSANNGNGATWVYDVSSGLWHERDFLNVMSGASMGHPSWNHSFWNGTHIVGDWRTNSLYQMDDIFFENAGVPITRVRRAPHISTELEMIRYDRFILDVETGVSAQGQSPIVLQSANGTLYQLGVTDAGLLTTTKVGTGTIQVIKLTDSTKATTWQIGVNNAGNLTTTSITLDLTQPLVFPIVSSTKISMWNLTVTSGGVLQTTKDTSGLPTLVLNGGQGPLVWLRFSDDGGHTWSNLQSRSMGAPGQYKQRVVWHRLGAARERTFEISCSEPVPVRIIDAYVNNVPGDPPQERLVHRIRKVA